MNLPLPDRTAMHEVASAASALSSIVFIAMGKHASSRYEREECIKRFLRSDICSENSSH